MGLEAELESFAVQNQKRPGVKCRLCSMPDDRLRQAVEAGYAKGMTSPTLSAFLASKGHEIPEHTVGNHMRKHVKR